MSPKDTVSLSILSHMIFCQSQWSRRSSLGDQSERAETRPMWFYLSIHFFAAVPHVTNGKNVRPQYCQYDIQDNYFPGKVLGLPWLDLVQTNLIGHCKVSNSSFECDSSSTRVLLVNYLSNQIHMQSKMFIEENYISFWRKAVFITLGHVALATSMQSRALRIKIKL